ncbi:MAG TPA: tetrahydrofolate dehydrogenase/cyclohydrolase catalytic domain-containing protein [Clostridia bacterium]|nr:tetrahydrofolate dehydrogenase/cyclohydrolase catalytic domain-containing protein [Clostridia bacterium]
MEALILDGRKIAKDMEAEGRGRAEYLREAHGITPTLATILVGEDPASVTYVRMKGNACRRTGIQSRKVILPGDSTTEDLLKAIEALNADEGVHGILLQHPVPQQIDERRCFQAIALEKDVDGVHTGNFGAMSMGLPCMFSATPYAIMTLLKAYNIPVAGKEAVVIGRSPILGKPVSMMLLNADATVTICHSKTERLPEVVHRADLVVAAVGKPRFVQGDWIKEGAVLIDAGYNPGNIGDIDLEQAIPHCSAYTPVPGGVGPVTIARLVGQTIDAAARRAGI